MESVASGQVGVMLRKTFVRLFGRGAAIHTSAKRANLDRSVYRLDPVDLSEPKFEKILIANRGEIACRVINTARHMGIKTVAVHSDVDSNALHVKMADEAVCVGPAPTNQSYLVMEKILKAVKDTGAQAVHPGYGFLSENMEFAKRLEEAGAKFIGPNSKAVRAMGDKIESKRIATNAKVNMIKGFDGEIETPEQAAKVAAEIGFPVMIKASAGGGGKGMRIAWNEKETMANFRLSKQEAASSFGDDRMLVEKYIDSGRHIEMQVMCDKHGNAIWLNERECSVQRRNQKVVEEAPSFFVDPDMRKRMGEQACALAKHVGYDSAGTVEFLVDSQKNFYFLEMNTRLQVEHPITECITGLDIVQQMIRAAYGHKLNITQKDIGIKGWAVEARVYAEDPFKNFGLPSIGRLSKYNEPLHIPGIRCDSGIREGSEISIYYDPLICKLISYGGDREEALNRMRDALDQYVIRGVTHNIPLLRDIVTEQVFRSGMYNTKYLPTTYPDGFKGASLSKPEEEGLAAFAAAYFATYEVNKAGFINRSEREETLVGAGASHSFYVTVPRADKAVETYLVKTWRDGDKLKTSIDGREVEIDGKIDLAKAIVDIKVGGHQFCAQVVSRSSGKLFVTYKGSPFRVTVMPVKAEKYSKYMPVKKGLDLSNVTIAPMAGMVKSVAVEVGQMVTEGMEICIIEAMKMQNSLTAPRDGKIKTINCKAGTTVEEGVILVELE